VRVSTDVGDWIKKKYLVLVHHRNGDDFSAYIITTKNGKGLTGLPKSKWAKYDRIFMVSERFDKLYWNERPFEVKGSVNFDLDPLSMVYLEPRPFPYKSLLYSTGAQLGRTEWESFRKMSVTKFTQDAKQLNNAKNIRVRGSEHANMYRPKLEKNGGPTFAPGVVPSHLLTLQSPASIHPSGPAVKNAKYMNMPREELVEEILALQASSEFQRVYQLSHPTQSEKQVQLPGRHQTRPCQRIADLPPKPPPSPTSPLPKPPTPRPARSASSMNLKMPTSSARMFGARS